VEVLKSGHRVELTDRLAADQGELKKGTILGRRSADGLLGPYASTVLAADALAGATDISVRDASNFRAGDAIVVGAESHTIASVSGNTITLSAGLAAAQTAGTVVEVTDGRQTAVSVLLVDADTAGSVKLVSVLVHGVVNKAVLVGDEEKADADLKGVLIL